MGRRLGRKYVRAWALFLAFMTASGGISTLILLRHPGNAAAEIAATVFAALSLIAVPLLAQTKRAVENYRPDTTSRGD